MTLGLFAGLLVGIGLKSAQLAAVLEPVGQIWINAVRMPVIPLVLSLLITSLAGSSDRRGVGRLALRTVFLFVAILCVFAICATMITPTLLGRLTLNAISTTALRASAAGDVGAAGIVTFREWLMSLIPANPLKAASEGLLLPVVIVGILYGLALGRIDSEARLVQIRFLQGVTGVMLIIVRWVIAVAPLGVFALAVVLGTHLGVSVIGAIAYYVAVVVCLLVIAGFALYLFTTILGGVGWRRLAKGLLPAQAVAFSSRSSLAALPILLEQTSSDFQIPDTVTSFVLPLAAGVFKPGAAIAAPVGAVFVSRLYGIELTGLQLAILAAGTVILSFSIPGIPSGSFLVQVPLYTAIGLPPEGLGILIALDALPDLFRTALNVTGYLSVAVIVGRLHPAVHGVPNPAV